MSEKFKLIEGDVQHEVDFKKVDENLELKKEIPSSYVEIKLPSMGKYGGPKSLHFRDYTFADIMDLNMNDESNKNLCKVLTNLNYEHFDISKLSEKDALVILYSLHRIFINKTIEKRIYIDETLSDDEINKEENITTVDIDLENLFIRNLGYDENDELIDDGKFKIPFTIKDNMTNDKIKLRIPILEDSQRAMDYCQEFYKNEIIKYSSIKSQILKLQSIKDEKKQDELFEEFYSTHEDECKQYYSFIERMSAMAVKIVQAMQIVSFNDKICDSLEEKLELFNDKISSGVWVQYENLLDKYDFGFSKNVEVFIPSLNKKEIKKIPFQISDFIPNNERKSDNRFSVEFD